MQDVSQLINPQLATDVIQFAKDHPAVTGTLATWATVTEGLPFVKRIKASGALELAWHILTGAATLIMNINKLRSSGKDGDNVGTGSQG